VNLAELESKLRPDTILLAVCAVDSELGTIQPMAAIANLLAKYPNCRFHVDATQAVGKIPIPMERIDTMSFAPHKFYGLCGTGILFKRKNLGLKPLLEGGSSTTIYRSGTPAVALAASTEMALNLALTNREEWFASVSTKQTFLRQALKIYPKVHINSPEGASPYILNLSVAGVRGETFQRLLNDRGVCVSVRSACATAGKPSQAVLAVSQDYWNALSSWRISLSHLTTEAELKEFINIFDVCYKKLTMDSK
jgi:cysteine desulfurase